MESFPAEEPVRTGLHKEIHEMLAGADLSAISLTIEDEEFQPAAEDAYLAPNMKLFSEPELPWEEEGYDPEADGLESEAERAELIRERLKYPEDTPLAHHWIDYDLYEEELEQADLATLTKLAHGDVEAWFAFSRNTADNTDFFGELLYTDLKRGKTLYQRLVTDDHYDVWLHRGVFTVLNDGQYNTDTGRYLSFEARELFEKDLGRKAEALCVELPSEEFNALIKGVEESGPYDSTVEFSFDKLDRYLRKNDHDEETSESVREAYLEALCEVFDKIDRGQTPGFRMSTM